MGSGSSRPQEIEIGESGFALLFPQIEGIKIQPFHFIKDPKNLTLERRRLIEVGKLLFFTVIPIPLIDCVRVWRRYTELGLWVVQTSGDRRVQSVSGLRKGVGVGRLCQARVYKDVSLGKRG